MPKEGGNVRKPSGANLKALVHKRQHQVRRQVGCLAQAEARCAHQVVVLPHTTCSMSFLGIGSQLGYIPGNDAVCRDACYFQHASKLGLLHPGG